VWSHWSDISCHILSRPRPEKKGRFKKKYEENLICFNAKFFCDTYPSKEKINLFKKLTKQKLGSYKDKKMPENVPSATME